MCSGATGRQQCDMEGMAWMDLGCPMGSVCDPPTGECVEPVCPHNGAHCLDLHTRQYCNETGSRWLDPSPCGPNLVCREVDQQNADCAPTICQPGEVGCQDDDTAQTCNDIGTDWIIEDCRDNRYSCDDDDGQCREQVCDPGDIHCEDDRILIVCDARGLHEDRVECRPDRVCRGNRCDVP